MKKRNWTFSGEIGDHNVTLLHGYWSGKRIILLNGEVLHESTKLYDTGSEHRFNADEKNCILRIRNSLFHFNYDLFVDGTLV